MKAKVQEHKFGLLFFSVLMAGLLYTACVSKPKAGEYGRNPSNAAGLTKADCGYLGGFGSYCGFDRYAGYFGFCDYGGYQGYLGYPAYEGYHGGKKVPQGGYAYIGYYGYPNSTLRGYQGYDGYCTYHGYPGYPYSQK